MRIDIINLDRFKSDYLSFGFKEEDFMFNEINIDQNTLTASIDLTDFFLSRNSEFHLTVPLAFRIISQLAIIFACTKLKYNKKPGEVYLRDISLKSKKPIIKSSNIIAELEIKKYRLVGDYFYFQGNIQIENGTMSGKGSMIVPVLQREMQKTQTAASDLSCLKMHK